MIRTIGTAPGVSLLHSGGYQTAVGSRWIGDWPLRAVINDLPDDTTAAGKARAFVRDVLSSWGVTAVDDLVLVCSELIELAVEGTGVSPPLRLAWRSGVVRVEVTQRWPKRDGGTVADHEQLLGAVLDALGAEWGVSSPDDVVSRWVELPC